MNKLNSSNIDKVLLDLTVRADFSNLESVRQEIFDCAYKFGFTDDISHLISLSVDEACTNLIRYAYDFDKKKIIQIVIENEGKNFIVHILDNGIPFNPTDVDSPDMNQYFNEFRRGGLGIFIIKKSMDSIRYTPASSNNIMNNLVLVKKLQ